MHCPVDNTELQHANLRGLEVDRCPRCSGEWLDQPQLDELENQVVPEGFPKGTIHFGDHPAGRDCPHCSREMIRFRYRGWPLELDRCPDDAGYWLDEGEESKVRDYMRERRSRLQRSASAEQRWQDVRRPSARKGLLDRIRDLFR